MIVPTKISLGGIQGIDSTLHTILQWMQEVESLRYDFKLLITMKTRNGVDNKWTDILHETFGEYMFNTVIRYQGKPVADASMNRKILLETQSLVLLRTTRTLWMKYLVLASLIIGRRLLIVFFVHWIAQQMTDVVKHMDSVTI